MMTRTFYDPHSARRLEKCTQLCNFCSWLQVCWVKTTLADVSRIQTFFIYPNLKPWPTATNRNHKFICHSKDVPDLKNENSDFFVNNDGWASCACITMILHPSLRCQRYSVMGNCSKFLVRFLQYYAGFSDISISQQPNTIPREMGNLNNITNRSSRI